MVLRMKSSGYKVGGCPGSIPGWFNTRLGHLKKEKSIDLIYVLYITYIYYIYSINFICIFYILNITYICRVKSVCYINRNSVKTYIG